MEPGTFRAAPGGMGAPHCRLLVIGESTDVRGAVLRALSEVEGAVVERARDGVMGLEQFELKAYDLVMSDWSVHELGLALVRGIRHSRRRSHTPVLLVARDVTPIALVEAIDAGVSGFVTAPVDGVALRHKAERLMASHGGRP